MRTTGGTNNGKLVQPEPLEMGEPITLGRLLFRKLPDEQRRKLLAGESIELYRSPEGQCAVVDIVDGKLVFSSVAPKSGEQSEHTN